MTLCQWRQLHIRVGVPTRKMSAGKEESASRTTGPKTTKGRAMSGRGKDCEQIHFGQTMMGTRYLHHVGPCLSCAHLLTFVVIFFKNNPQDSWGGHMLMRRGDWGHLTFKIPGYAMT